MGVAFEYNLDRAWTFGLTALCAVEIEEPAAGIGKQMKKDVSFKRMRAGRLALCAKSVGLRRHTVVLALVAISVAAWSGGAAFAQSAYGVRSYSYSTPDDSELSHAPSPEFAVNDADAQTEFKRLPDYPESQVTNYARSSDNARYEQESWEEDVHGETLEEAIQIAVEQSRTQRALALRRGASQSAVDAALSLRNPKINNTTAYTGLLNQPKARSNVDLGGTMSTITSVLPPEVVEAIAPALAGMPTQLPVTTPLVDKDFVTTVTSVVIPVYLGGRVRALAQEAEALTQAIAAGEEIDLQKVKLEATEAYFLVLRMRSLHQVAVEAVATAQSHLNDATRMEKVGVVTRNVVLAAQVAYSEAQQVELQVATAQTIAETAYNRVLWRPLDSPVVLQDREPHAPLSDVDALMDAAVATRGELKALSAERRAFEAQVNVARADVRPQVAAMGAYSYVENSHMTANSNATASIGVTWTPFDGGTSRARQQTARQNAMAAARMREEAESGIRMQVRQAWLLQREAYERIEIARVAVEQAQENHRVVTRGFQEGVLNHTEALDASTRLTAAKSGYTNAKYDAMLATEHLKSAVGNL